MLRWLVYLQWSTGFRPTKHQGVDEGVDEGCWIRLPAYCLSDDLDGDNPASLEQLQAVKQALDEQLADIRKQLQEGQGQIQEQLRDLKATAGGTKSNPGATTGSQGSDDVTS